jgi:endonuclease/exonuclease/phosphatase (EEP) superfamily protein YafD
VRGALRRLRYGLIALVALLGGLTALGLLDRWSTYLELATLYRFHYAVLLGVAALAAISLRSFAVALAALLLACVNALVISQVPSGPPTAGLGSARLRALIINVRDRNDEYQQVGRLIAESDPDIIGLTELTPAWARGLEFALKAYPSRRLEPLEGVYGVGLYGKRRFEAARIERFPPDGPPTVVARLTLAARPVVVVIVHVRTIVDGAARDRQLRALADELKTLGELLVVCGDFNSVPWSESIRNLADEVDLRSVFGRFGQAATWPTHVRVLRIPIDNCLASEGVAVIERRIGPDVGSDHLPLIVDFAPADGR